MVDLADGLDERGAEQEPVAHRLAADVEVAVLQAHGLVDRGVRLVDVEGRRLRLGEDLDARCARSSIAPVASFGFSVPGRRAGNHARRPQDELGPDPRGDRVRLGRLVGIHHDLGDPVPVAEVEEDQVAVVPPPVDPAGQAGLAAGIGRAKVAAGVGAVRRREVVEGVREHGGSVMVPVS